MTQEELMAEVTEKWEQHLLMMAVTDPLCKYEREQDHFMKYADPAEVKAWIDYNKQCKANNKNRFGSTGDSNFKWRDLIEAPSYIITMLEYYYPGYFNSTPAGLQRARNFARRNPLFCKAEVI